MGGQGRPGGDVTLGSRARPVLHSCCQEHSTHSQPPSPAGPTSRGPGWFLAGPVCPAKIQAVLRSLEGNLRESRSRMPAAGDTVPASYRPPAAPTAPALTPWLAAPLLQHQGQPQWLPAWWHAPAYPSAFFIHSHGLTGQHRAHSEFRSTSPRARPSSFSTPARRGPCG